MINLSIIVPALNEEENLRPAVGAILESLGPLCGLLDVLVFDDASTDGTAAIADQLAHEDRRVRAFHNPARLNIGGIYKAGIREARGDYVLLVPGDNETRVDDIANALGHLDRSDLIVFYVTNTAVRPFMRRALSPVYVHVVNVLFRTRFLYTNGTNIFRTEVVRRIPIRTDGFSYQTEAVVKAALAGVPFTQVGMRLKGRDRGTSKAISFRNLQSVVVALTRLWSDVRWRERARYRGGQRLVGIY